MATPRQLYKQKPMGYWESSVSRNTYLVFMCDYKQKTSTKEVIECRAHAINLRTGKSLKLNLQDFIRLKRPDRELENYLDSQIDSQTSFCSRLAQRQPKYIREEAVFGALKSQPCSDTDFIRAQYDKLPESKKGEFLQHILESRSLKRRNLA
jgi:hypothetical protein